MTTIRRARLGGFVAGAAVGALAALAAVAIGRSSASDPDHRFAEATSLLSSRRITRRIAGVAAMASLADEWHEGRQACIDVLCGSVRLAGAVDGPAADDDRIVRRTIMDAIGARLRSTPIPGISWHEHRFDLSDTVIDGANLSRVKLTAGSLDFSRCVFTGAIQFNRAIVDGGELSFVEAEFVEGTVGFSGARFVSGTVHFSWGEVTGGRLDFDGSTVCGAELDFRGVELQSGEISFRSASVESGSIELGFSDIGGGQISFAQAAFAGGRVNLSGSELASGTLDLRGARFTGGTVDLHDVAVADDADGEPAIRHDGPASGLLLG